MPKRLNSGFGHHRLESCGPSHSRHKIAEDYPNFFAMLRSLPSAIYDALDTLYELNVVFSQFLGSASMIFFFSFAFLASSSCLAFSCCSRLFFLSFYFSGVFFAFFSFLSFPFFSYLFFVSFFQLTCVCRAYA